MRSFRDMNPVAVGVVSVLAIAALCAGAFAVGTLGVLEDRYSMSGVFSDTGGLRSGDPVKVAGVDVGEVTAVEPDFDAGHVVIRWEVDRGIDLGPETTAEIALGTLLGGEHLRLAGPVEEPYLADVPSDERRIPIERTSVPTSVADALGDATRTVQEVDVDDVNRVLGGFADVADRTGEDVGALLGHLETVAAAVAAREDDVSRLVDSSRTVVDTLAERDQQLVALVDAASVLLDQIAQRRDELAAVLGEGSDAVVALTSVVAGHRASLDAVLADLHVAIDAAGRQIEPLNESLAWMGPTFWGISRAGAHGPWIDVVFEGLGPDAIGILRQQIAATTPGEDPEP
jgi:phospholipid/cholesterol/gamma-HCH transport system substrate-binding protein